MHMTPSDRGVTTDYLLTTVSSYSKLVNSQTAQKTSTPLGITNPFSAPSRALTKQAPTLEHQAQSNIPALNLLYQISTKPIQLQLHLTYQSIRQIHHHHASPPVRRPRQSSPATDPASPRPLLERHQRHPQRRARERDPRSRQRHQRQTERPALQSRRCEKRRRCQEHPRPRFPRLCRLVCRYV